MGEGCCRRTARSALAQPGRACQTGGERRHWLETCPGFLSWVLKSISNLISSLSMFEPRLEACEITAIHNPGVICGDPLVHGFDDCGRVTDGHTWALGVAEADLGGFD